MESIVQNAPGWLALTIIIIDRVIIPIANKVVPAKVKSDSEQLKHTLSMEEKKLEADLATQERLTKSIEELTKTQATQTELSRVTNERLNRLEDGQKEILDRLPKPRKAAK